MSEERTPVAGSTTIRVTSEPPQTEPASGIDPQVLSLFRSMMDPSDRETVLPYIHQASAFVEVLADREVALVAGTASGKTLAIATPLFHKVFALERARKLIFVYPTRALLADQRRILEGLAANSGHPEAIGEVRGGMTSAGLIRAMSKRVIVATPDALYWFFRKNVKFTMTLIYGLAQADEIVLDEAHLYTGLMQRNMWHFIERLRSYRERYIHAPLRVHYLTATANERLRSFSPQAVIIEGRSKCTDVTVHLRPVPRLQRSTALVESLREALQHGAKRVLLVSNSARVAHQLFMTNGKQLKTAEQRAAVPARFWEGFGLIGAGEAIAQAEAMDPALARHLAQQIREELAIRPRDLARTKVALQAEYLGELACKPVERDLREVRRLLERYRRQHGETIERGPFGLLRANAGVDDALRRLDLPLDRCATIEEALQALDNHGQTVTAAIQQTIDAKDGGQGVWLGGEVKAAVGALLPEQGLTTGMRSWIMLWMSRRLEINRDSVQQWATLDPTVFKERLVQLRRILGWVEDATARATLASRLVRATAGHIAIATAPKLPGEPLLILYTGSMARYAREGLIELFASTPGNRPVVLLSTSAVEVGVDFAADVLITEECAGSSLLQRLGRIGRRPGVEATAWILVEPGMPGRIQASLGTAGKTERGTFMETIATCFPERSHVERSTYADALQVLVSQQVGRSGGHAEVANDAGTLALAGQIAAAGIEIEYGLRGTMPAVSLLDEGVSKDPFYILGYVEDKHILPPATPFEVAAIDKSFNALAFAKSWRRIFVCLPEAIKRAMAVAVPDGQGALILADRREDWPEALRECNPAQLYAQACKFIVNLPAVLAKSRARMLASKYPMLPVTACDAPHLLLAYGPLPLSYSELDSEEMRPLCDQLGERIELPEQWYLVLRHAASADQAWAYLEGAEAIGFENEVYYDADRPMSKQDPGMALLDKQAGAVWDLWETLCERGWQ